MLCTNDITLGILSYSIAEHNEVYQSIIRYSIAEYRRAKRRIREHNVE